MIFAVIFVFCASFLTTTGAVVPPTQCPAVDGNFPVYIPDADCTKFWECSNGTPYLFDCPANLHFNPVLNVCDWPQNAGCTGGGGTDGSGATTTESGNNGDGGDGDSNRTTPSDGDNDKNQICLQAKKDCPAVDGEYPVYLPLPDCSKFCQCSNGKPYLHDCPDNLHFNPVLNVCDWPQDAGCSGGNGTDGSAATTTESSNNGGGGDGDSNGTTPSDGDDDKNQICLQANKDCPAVDGEYPVYLPLPDCSKFCQCSNGKPYLHDCPDNLHFNPVLNVCDWPQDAGCSGGNGTDGSAATTTESSNNGGGGDGDSNGTTPSDGDDDKNQICLQANKDCPAVDGEYPVYLPLPDCSKFCQCSNGKPYLHDCPDNLHFNPVLNVCDWPQDAGCSGGNGTDGSAATTTESSNNGGGGDGDSNGTTPSDGDDDKNQICLQANKVCPAVDGEYPVYLPLPDCSKFCQCSNGKPYLHDCPDNLHFNSALNVCDWPQNAGCSGGNGTDGSAATTTESSNNGGGGDGDSNGTTPGDGDDDKNQICLQANKVCPAVDGEYPVYLPLPDCSKFCQCSNGKPYLHDCPDNLHFNPVLNICDWPQNAGCSGGNGTDGSAATTTESSNNGGGGDGDSNGTTPGDGDDDKNQICLQANKDCPAVDGEYPVYLPLPDCSKFCQCSNGKPYLHDCPDNLHFNPVLNVCDWPQNAGCSGGNGTDGSAATTTERSNNGGGGDGDSNGMTPSDGGDDKNQICLQANKDCPAVDGEYPVYIPLPNCSQFCQCSNGKPYLFDCPGDLHFNPVLNVCDWQENAHCEEINP